jgi:hypothetical protein
MLVATLLVGGPLDGKIANMDGASPERVEEPTWGGAYVLTTLSANVRIYLFHSKVSRWLPRKRRGGFPAHA